MVHIDAPYRINCVAEPFDDHKERIRVTANLEREMKRKYMRRDYHIIPLDNCVMCEFKETGEIFY